MRILTKKKGVVLLTALITGGLMLTQREPLRTTQASVPPFVDVNRDFTPVDLAISDINPFPAGLAGGLIVFIRTEDPCGGASLRILADPDRVHTILSATIPPEGYVLARRYGQVYHADTNTCGPEYQGHDPYKASNPMLSQAGSFTAGAHDVDAYTTRVIIAYQRYEGGYVAAPACPGGPTPAPGAVDLNGDGDVADQIVQYSKVLIDKVSRNVTQVEGMVNTSFIGDGPYLATNGKQIAALTQETSLGSCSCVAGLWTCPGTDLNGDGEAGTAVLRFYDVDTGMPSNSGLGLEPWPCVTESGRVRYPELAPPGGVQPLFVMGDSLLAFLTREFPTLVPPAPCMGKPAVDLNGDGDVNDLVIRYLDLNDLPSVTVRLGPTLSQNTENLSYPGSSQANPDAGLIGTDRRTIAFAVEEPFTSPGMPPCTDPSGNCMGGDRVLHIFDASTKETKAVGSATTFGSVVYGPMFHSKFNGGIATFMTPEFGEGYADGMPGTDFNCDDTMTDDILRFLNLNNVPNPPVVNTRIPMVDRDGSGANLSMRWLVGTDGTIILYEDFNPPTYSLHYIRTTAGTPAGSCGSPPPNQPPIATAQSVTTAEDTAVSIVLSGTDPDGDPLTYSVVSGPTHGSLSGMAPNVNYTPAANYHGSDSFTFKVNDGTVDSVPATVSITVTPVSATPAQLIQRLIREVQNLKLPKGIEQSLTTKLDNALKSLDKGQKKAATNQIQAFIHEVNAQRGKTLTPVQADRLVAQTQIIIALIGG